MSLPKSQFRSLFIFCIISLALCFYFSFFFSFKIPFLGYEMMASLRSYGKYVVSFFIFFFNGLLGLLAAGGGRGDLKGEGKKKIQKSQTGNRRGRRRRRKVRTKLSESKPYSAN